MPTTFKPARPTGLAILAIACATALSLSACSKSHDEKSSEKSSPATTSPAASNGKNKDSVQGLIASVSGNSAQVTEKSGAATVDVDPSAKITEYSDALLTDFAAGSCVRANFKPGPNPGPSVAISLQMNPAGGDGKCPQPKTVPSGSPGALLPAGDAQALVGTIASVAGNAVTVAVTDADGKSSQTELTITDQTRKTKGVPVPPQAVAQGKCISAVGTKDGGGTLQATFVSLAPGTNGGCPQFGVKGQPAPPVPPGQPH